MGRVWLVRGFVWEVLAFGSSVFTVLGGMELVLRTLNRPSDISDHPASGNSSVTFYKDVNPLR